MSIAARPFAFPYRGRLDPAATALMVIDMQVDFLAPVPDFALKGYDPTPLRAIIPAFAAVVFTHFCCSESRVLNRSGGDSA
jgi:hypothetical protein